MNGQAQDAAGRSSSESLRKLDESAQRVIRGDYNAAREMFQLTASESESPEVRELAETLGLMSVKVEAREFSLEQKIEEIGAKNRELERAGILRAESGFLFCSMVLILSVYTMVLSAGLSERWISDSTEKPITLGLMFVILVFMGVFVRRHVHPWTTWGLTWKGGGRAIAESLLWCVPWALLAVGIKWRLVHTPSNPLHGQALFDWNLPAVPVAIYLLVAIVQEIINRGFVQSAIERVLTGKHRALMAVVTTSVMFAVAHLHYSTATMVATLVSGLFFGWLYRRHQTVVGVSLAHFLLGTLVMDVLHLIG